MSIGPNRNQMMWPLASILIVLIASSSMVVGQTVPLPRSNPPSVMSGVRFEGNTSIVNFVIKGGPADRAGIRPGDEILSIGEKYIIQPGDLLDSFYQKEPGDVVKLEVKRRNQFLFFDLTLIPSKNGNIEINSDGSIKDLDKPGLLNKVGPELTVDQWFAIPEGLTPRLKPNRGKVICMILFQFDCPWSREKGLPQLKAMQDAFADDPEVLLFAIHTPFRNFETNNHSNAIRLVKEIGLDIPVGQDGSVDKRTVTYDAYRAYGTPWFVVLDKQGVVRFNNYDFPIRDARKLFNKLKAESGEAESGEAEAEPSQ